MKYEEARQNHLLPFVKQFKETYKEKKETLIVAHNDADGITSAVVFSKILDKLGLIYKLDYFVYFGDNEIRGAELSASHELSKRIKESQVVIYLDYLSIHAEKSGKKIFIVDHHNKQGYGYENAVWYCPLDKDIYRPSACALCYDVYNELFGENHEMKLIGTIGSVGDSMFPNSLEYLKIKQDEQPFFLGTQISWFFFNAQKIFLLAKDNASCLRIYCLLIEKLTNKSLSDLLVLPEPLEKEIYKKLKKDKEVILRIKDKLEIYAEQKLIFLEMSAAEASSKDAVFSYLWLYYPGYLITININFGGVASLSMRSNTYDIYDVFGKIQSKIDDLQFGGHPFAAGGKIPNESISLLKDLIISEVNSGNVKKIY